jgi:RNA 3'-terminal phosphate cyclase
VRLAEELDSAAGAARRAASVAERVLKELGPESALYEEVEALRAKLAERTALDRIGARLQTSLDALGLTPKGRGGVRTPAKPSQTPLGQLSGPTGVVR